MDNGNRIENLFTIYSQSFESLEFSSSDKKTVKSFIHENNIDKREKDIIRSKLFEMARQKLNSEENLRVINWLENANKSLFTSKISNKENEVFFSPGDECASAIISRIRLATEEIHVCVFTISDDRIADALLYANQLGVPIKIITDNDKMTDEGSDIKKLAKAGIAVKIDNSDNYMHHKFVIIDKRIVITGSYNWTRSAARYNQENLLVTDNHRIVSSYEYEFEKLWNQMYEFIV